MKKYLIVLAAAIVALAGCKPEAGNKYTKISFKEASLELAVGETTKLKVLYEPTTLEAPVCEWASSDTSVVTVDQNGNIAALAIGKANITAKYGELTAVCAVAVQDPMDLIVWGGWSLWSLDRSTILSQDTLKTRITYNGGTDVSCVLIPATYKVWSDGIYTDDEGYLNGSGYVIDATGTVWLITDALDSNGANFYYLGSNGLYFVDPAQYNANDTAFAYCCPAGKLGTAEQQLEWLNDTTELLEPGFNGSKIGAVDYDNERWLDYFAGYPGTGVFVGDETTAYYRFNASWFEDTDEYYALYGLLGEVKEDGYWYPNEPAVWAPTVNKYYELLPPTDEAPKYSAKPLAPMHRDNKLARPMNVLSHK